jgi:hypothetical protein
LTLQGPLLDADCSGCCNIKLQNSHVAITGEHLAGTMLLGGKAALTVRNTSLLGLSLAPGTKGLMGDVSVTIVLSRCRNCSIDASILADTAIVNSEFSEPPLSEAVQGSLLSCDALQKSQICDRQGTCTNNTAGGRQCSCPSGFDPDTSNDGSRCLDVCSLAAAQRVYADNGQDPLGAGSASVTDSTRLSFSRMLDHLSGKGVDASTINVWIVPTTGTHSVPLANTTGLIQTGSTSTGIYEVQLRTERTVCKVVDKLRVSCTPGYSSADADGMACMPKVVISAASIRIFSSTGDVLFDGGRLVAPIIAGDKLRVEVKAYDINGTLVTRSSLGLEVALEKIPAGKSKNNTAPFKPPADNTSSVFVFTVPEMWISEAAEYRSAAPAALAVSPSAGWALACACTPAVPWTALRVMHFLVHSTLAYTLPIDAVQSSSRNIAIGSSAAVLAAAGLALAM